MKHVVVGTAGHIDHGKTELVKALTGVNTDRFKEEKERGITIDIGFAPLVLGPGLTVGFVDVPGHERFIKNMLAGVWGIDLVLMVIAADESIKPQTREHFHICSLLHVKRGVIALTKADLVDSDLIDLASLEIRDFVRGSFLDQAPVVPVSARTGIGLDRLREALLAVAEGVEPGRASGLLRLPVDRSFTMHGFGTVVTGTLVSGQLSVGEDVALYPAGRISRVRGLQVHGAPVEESGAGQRTAVNLQGLDSNEVERGQVLGRPGEMRASSLLDVRLSLLPGAPAPLADMSRVRFHQGTAELLARVKLIGCRVLDPGGEGFAQLRLERPGCLLPRDRFVIRRYSPTITIGGGVVLDAHPPKRRGAPDERLLRRLSCLASNDPPAMLRARLEGRGGGMEVAELALQAGMSIPDIDRYLRAAIESGEVVRTGEGGSSSLMTREDVVRIKARVTGALAAYHKDNALRPGMPREELREQTLGDIPRDVSRFLVDSMIAEGAIRAVKDTISLAAHRVTLGAEEARIMDLMESDFERGGLNPPDLEELIQANAFDAGRARRILHLMLDDGRLVRIRDGKVFHARALEGLKARLWEVRATRHTIDISTFKELTGTSRKNAIPLLEHLDAVRVTRRVGSDREILPPSGS